MVSFFEPCADSIMELIQGQLDQIEDRRNTRLRVRDPPKTIYKTNTKTNGQSQLPECDASWWFRPVSVSARNHSRVSRFQRSQSTNTRYLVSEILRVKVIQIKVNINSWTAVVRGAAIFGIEKPNNKSLSAMSACVRSYGLSVNAPFSGVAHNTKDLVVDPLTNATMAKGQLKWLVKKGDLILSNRPKETSYTFTINFTETGSRKGNIPIYAYDGDDLPDRLSNSRSGMLISSWLLDQLADST